MSEPTTGWKRWFHRYGLFVSASFMFIAALQSVLNNEPALFLFQMLIGVFLVFVGAHGNGWLGE